MKIGIDLGGTKTEIAVFDAAGAELLRRREPTPSDDYAATLALIVKLVSDAERELGTTGTIGIGTQRQIAMERRGQRSAWIYQPVQLLPPDGQFDHTHSQEP